MARKSMRGGGRGAGVAKSRSAARRASYRKMRDDAVAFLPDYARDFLRNQTRVKAIKLYNAYLIVANQLGTDRLGLGPEPHRAQMPIVRRALRVGFAKGFIKNKGFFGSVAGSLMEFAKNPAIQFAAAVATAGTAAVAFSGAAATGAATTTAATATATTTTAATTAATATAATSASILPASLSGSAVLKAGGAAVSAAGALFEKEKKRVIDQATAAVTDPSAIAELAGKAFGDQARVVIQQPTIVPARQIAPVSVVDVEQAAPELVAEDQKNKTANGIALATIAAAILFG